jgi:hypothetical protein
MLGELAGLVLLEDVHVADAAVAEVRKREVDEAEDTGERHRRLRADLRQHVEAAPFASRQDDREHPRAAQLQGVTCRGDSDLALKRRFRGGTLCG